jgi:mannonate dehydratase
MRIGCGQFNEPRPEYLNFAKQYGATDVLFNTPRLPEVNGAWALVDLVKLRLAVEQYGLKLSALENVPNSFFDHVILGGPRRDEQIENMFTTIRNIARAGIPRFGYGWMPSHVWRTTPATIRGGAIATAFDQKEASGFPNTHDREYTEEEMWQNLEYWIRAITPVAEEEGILLGIHPCDPPVPVLGGIPLLFRSFESYKRLFKIVDSPNNGVELCQGTFAEMEDGAGEGIYKMIEYFAERKKILYVHFRNVSGPVPSFKEEFINTGHVDMHRAMSIYQKHNYDSFFIPDHVPRTFGDSDWGHRGRAFGLGYLQCLVESAARG